MFLDLVHNVAFLVALVAAAQMVIARFHEKRVGKQLFLGLLFGGVVVLGMATPVSFAPGIIFDGRAIVLSTAAVVGGGVTAGISTAIAVLYRVWLGGNGVAVGVTTIIVAAVIGWFAKLFWQRKNIQPKHAHFFILGVIVQLGMFCAFTQLPEGVGYKFIREAGVYLLIFCPLGTMLLCQIFVDYEHRRNAEEAVARERGFLRTLINTLPDLIWLKNTQGVFLACNTRVERLFGARESEIVGKTDYDFVDKELADHFRRMDRQAMERNAVSKNEEEVAFADDCHRELLETTKVPMRDAEGNVLGILGIGHDTTERRRNELELKQAANVFLHANEGITITDSKGMIIDVNEAFCRITGYAREEAIGHNPNILRSDKQNQEFYGAMWGALVTKGVWSGEIWNRRKNGEQFVAMLSISSVRDGSGAPLNYVGLFTDITAMKEQEQRLQQIAYFDVLTNLPNRVLLSDRLNQALAQCQRRSNSLAVVYLDLDGFKEINDRWGHNVGDELLIVIAHRMKQVLREGDTLARMGGDEFVAILGDLEGPRDADPLFAQLLEAAADPVVIDDKMLQVTASIGVTLYPQDRSDADQLLRHADHAMYVAKQAGKNRYCRFDATQDVAVKSQNEAVQGIQDALGRNEFVLHFQPKINMRTGAVIGAEALIRWNHPDLGLLMPASFLPVIEDHQVSDELGFWVIDAALRQLETWRSLGADFPVSINVGAQQLLQPDFVQRLQSRLAAHPEVSPSQLQIEILETSAFKDLGRASQIIGECRRLGVEFALDDFGTGYSSLTYLRHMPVDVLKIDKSFVGNMIEDAEDRAIVAGVISLGQAFNRAVIAEGVETLEHGRALLDMGCALGQGFGIARPMPAEDVLRWVERWRMPDLWRSVSESQNITLRRSITAR